MYAIIEDGAHQYKVQEGDRLEVQLRDLTDDQKTIEFDKVLMIGDGAKSNIGHPYVSGAKVAATIQREIKGDKLVIQKIRRRKNYRLRKGHRQRYLQVTIDKINVGRTRSAAPKPKPAEDASTD
ncbi:MAG: 50S ribosomal protein L21 [Planctomycetes bacterium]|nr:50S ribosomal protein L21 [Planctomycetota bacterium]